MVQSEKDDVDKAQGMADKKEQELQSALNELTILIKNKLQIQSQKEEELKSAVDELKNKLQMQSHSAQTISHTSARNTREINPGGKVQNLVRKFS